MVQTSLSTQTKVLLVSAAALATGLAAYALGYYDYDWRLWDQQAPQQLVTDGEARRQYGQDLQTEQWDQRQLGQDLQTDGIAIRQPLQDLLQTEQGGIASRQTTSATFLDDPRLPDAIVGRTYEVRLRASTGLNTRWILEQGALPAGLTLDEAQGIIRGVPLQPGTSLFRLKFGRGDSDGVSQFTIRVVTGEESPVQQQNQQQSPISIITDSLLAGQRGQVYSKRMLGQGGDPASYRWSVRGTLPTGISLTEQGEFTGTPTQAGTFLFSVVLNAQQVSWYEVSRQYALVINDAAVAAPDAPLTISTVELPAGRVGVNYSYNLVATGGPASARYIWSLTNGGALPPGITFTPGGVFGGVPTQAGTYTLYLTKVSVEGRPDLNDSKDFTLRILPREETAPPASTALIISGGYPDGTIGSYYSASPLQASGGQGSYEWSLVSGNLPTGLYLSPNSQISGYANQYGIFTFTIQVRDQANHTARAERTINVRPSQPVISASLDPDLSNRLRRIDLMGVQVHDLIKLQDDGNPDTQYDTTVYYIGADGRRHSFPNPKVYFSWFPDFSRVRVVAARELADIPLGANLTYRPGTRLVKFATDPRVYAVDSDRRLRWVKVESVAQALYGNFWMRQVDDISDAFYMDYRFGPDVNQSGDYSVNGAQTNAAFPSDVLPR